MVSTQGREKGFTYLGLIVTVAIIGLVGAATLKVDALLRRAAAEQELLEIGATFSEALRSYADATPRGQPQLPPPSLQDLLKDPRYPGVRRHLRKIFVDPMTGKAEWGIVYANNPNGASTVMGTGVGTGTGSGLDSGLGSGAGNGVGSAARSGWGSGTGTGGSGVLAVYSLSQARPLKVANFDARFQNLENKEHISDWKFAATGQALSQPRQLLAGQAPPGQATPAQPAGSLFGQPPGQGPAQPAQPGQLGQPGQTATTAAPSLFRNAPPAPQNGQAPSDPPPQEPRQEPPQAVPQAAPQEAPHEPQGANSGQDSQDGAREQSAPASDASQAS
jgi:type II secretory pathway pseudopilin PulG